MDINKEVSPEFNFYLADGKCLKSLSELAVSLKSMEDWVFNHHVTAEKNDFSNWIRDIYGDKELAKKILKKDKKKVFKILGTELEKAFKKAQKQRQIEERQETLPVEIVKGENNVKRISSPRKKSAILKMLKN